LNPRCVFIGHIHALLDRLFDTGCTPFRVAPSVDARRHRGDHGDKIVDKIIPRVGWKDRLQPASRRLEEHLDVAPPEAREAIFVLDDDDPDLGVTQQFVQFGTIVVDA
jgi:hypothetical protein